MGETTFEAVLAHRVEEILDACTRCGKCFEVCPIIDAAKIADAPPVAVLHGVMDILRTGDGPAASRRWASACVSSGECIKACDYGVNPRFMLNMARVAIARAEHDPAASRRIGVESFRSVSEGVKVLSRLQLDDAVLARLGQKPARASELDAAERPDFVFYTGCNVLKTPHIALFCLDIMDALGVTYRVMGGPTHCCGIVQLRGGDVETSGRMGTNTLDKLAQSKSGQVLSWCPSCQVQFAEITLPTIERSRGSRPFEMTPFLMFLAGKLAELRPLLRKRVDMRIALHRHPGLPGVMDAAQRLLGSVPGIELVDLKQPAVGLMSNYLRALPEYKRELQLAELAAARAAGVDALVAVYHADHRELCAHERDFPFQIVNLLELIGASMGLHHDDHFKRLKMMQDADVIVADCADLIVRHGLDADEARRVVASAMLAEQPLPLIGPNGHRP
ncbi:MAG: heterodisulfide reductase-related iron-sulfur binding cluster [Xanthobacteraceae bacterium]